MNIRIDIRMDKWKKLLLHFTIQDKLKLYKSASVNGDIMLHVSFAIPYTEKSQKLCNKQEMKRHNNIFYINW